MLNDLASEFLLEFPQDNLDSNSIIDFDDWITESFYLAKGFVYKGEF